MRGTVEEKLDFQKQSGIIVVRHFTPEPQAEMACSLQVVYAHWLGDTTMQETKKSEAGDEISRRDYSSLNSETTRRHKP
jgi:hypothetical protein